MENNTFDPNELQKFFDNRDYWGAARYLENIPAKPDKQSALNAKIKEIKRNAAIQDNFLSKANEDDRAAYHFSAGLKGEGTIPENEDNVYARKYLDCINNLQVIEGTDKGKKIDKIQIDLESKELFNIYLKNLGIDEYQLVNDKNVSYLNNSRNGHVELLVSTNNKELVDFLYNAQSLIPVYTGSTGTSGGGFVGSGRTKPYTIRGVSEGKAYDADLFNYENIFRAKNIVSDARRKEEKLVKESQLEYDEEMFITPFLGLGHERAYNKMKKGLISIDDYNKIVKERTDAYNRILAGAGLSQYEVYMATGEDDKAMRLEKVENNKGQRDKITEYILDAMKDDRISYQAASIAGNIGTYITIFPKTNEKKEKVSGEYGQFRRIFVPGLFKSSCEETFNNDTKTMSVRDNSDMKHWKYGKTLNDGTYVGYDDNGAYTTINDNNGVARRSYMSEQDMLQLLNKDNIINKSVETILSNIDNEGNPKTRTINGKKVTFDIEDMVNTLSIAGINELYPAGTYSDEERLRYQNEMSNIIKNILRKTFYKQHNINN